MSWQAGSLAMLVLVLAGGFLWYERSRPPARVLALVAAMAALAVVGRLAFAAIPNVKPTTDIVLFAGYALGAVPGFAVGAVTAIASNVFLGQGPWTAWQMMGWGAVGVSGAVLARLMGRRELGRAPLALACGLAGAAFGVWMDVYQWTLAARQDLDTYLVIAGSSFPYNAAHVIGNVAFALLIGPPLVRALRRYRRRFEVVWEPSRTQAGVVVAALAALAVTAGASGGEAAADAAAPARAEAAVISPAGRAAAEDAVRAEAAAGSPAARAAAYLLRSQNRDGGFPSSRGGSSTQLLSGWSALGLAAAGHNPRDVKRRGGRSLADYLVRSARGLRDVGELERTILVLRAAGLSPRRFAGRDLVAELRRRLRSDGSVAGYVSYTAFGLLALRASGQPLPQSSLAWLEAAQNEDGGFGVAPSATSDTDMTGAVLQALAAAGRPRGDVADRAGAYLLGTQRRDGGFPQMRGRSSNAQSTAYAVQGLLATRAAPGQVRLALRYLTRLQARDGSVRYSRTSSQTPVWVTAQALMALRGKPLPLSVVPRKRRARPAVAAVAPPAPARRARERSAKRSAAAAGEKRKPAEKAKKRTSASQQLARRQEPAAADPRPARAEAPAEAEGPAGLAIAAGVGGALILLLVLRRQLRGRRRPATG